ncbi:MAG: hypothetical protein ABSH08_16495, partial [Tepidisphaeraceae bacterium]
MTQQVPDPTRGPYPLGYEVVDRNRRPPLGTAVAIISICVAFLSVWANGFSERRAIDDMWHAVHDPIRIQHIMAAQAVHNSVARKNAATR